MSNHCKIEFYFKIDEVRKLIEANPDAKGLIIRQKITPRKTSDHETANVTVISAYVDGGTPKQAATVIATAVADEPTDSITGCPYPPGCN